MSSPEPLACNESLRSSPKPPSVDVVCQRVSLSFTFDREFRHTIINVCIIGFDCGWLECRSQSDISFCSNFDLQYLLQHQSTSGESSKAGLGSRELWRLVDCQFVYVTIGGVERSMWWSFWDVDSAWVSRQRHSLGVLGDIGGPCLCFIIISPVVKPFVAYAMSLGIREMGFVEVAGWEDSDFWSACLRLTWNSWAQQSHCVVVASHYTTFRVNSAVTSNLGYYGTPTALTRSVYIHDDLQGIGHWLKEVLSWSWWYELSSSNYIMLG